MPDFAMVFAVAVPRPLPLVGRVKLSPDGEIDAPPGVRGMLLTLGAASAFYGLPVKELRAQWVRAAAADPKVDDGNYAAWGIAAEEWAEARAACKPEPTPLPSEDCRCWHPFGATADI